MKNIAPKFMVMVYLFEKFLHATNEREKKRKEKSKHKKENRL